MGHILHEILGMRKLSAQWTLRLFTTDNKCNRETTSEQCLMLFKRNPKEFLGRFVIFEETWIHWYTLEIKEQSKQWNSPIERAPKKWKTVLLAGMVMATIFWDSQGVIYIDYLEKCKTVTGLYYAELLGRFDAELQKNGLICQRKKCSSNMTTHRLTPSPS
jgi:Transposase.